MSVTARVVLAVAAVALAAWLGRAGWSAAARAVDAGGERATGAAARLAGLVAAVPVPAVVGRAAASAALPVPEALVSLAFPASVLGGVVMGLVVSGPGLALLLGASGPPAIAAGLWIGRGRADRLLEAGLPHALEEIARGLRSGGSALLAITQASKGSGLAAAELRVVVRDTAHGDSLVVALDRWAERRPLPGVRLAVAALALGVEAGGARSSTVDAVAATVRERVRLERDAAGSATQARASAVVLAVAPLGFMVVAITSDPRTATFLFRTPLGLGCLAAGLALDGLAAVWMAAITRPPR